LKTFFCVVGKDPVGVRAKDVLAVVTSQQQPRAGAENVRRISDGASGQSAAMVRRRLAAVSAFYGYLITRGDTGVETNPVPRGLSTRRRRRLGTRRNRHLTPERFSFGRANVEHGGVVRTSRSVS
jgi:hypothetical protein